MDIRDKGGVRGFRVDSIIVVGGKGEGHSLNTGGRLTYADHPSRLGALGFPSRDEAKDLINKAGGISRCEKIR